MYKYQRRASTDGLSTIRDNRALEKTSLILLTAVLVGCGGGGGGSSDTDNNLAPSPGGIVQPETGGPIATNPIGTNPITSDPIGSDPTGSDPGGAVVQPDTGVAGGDLTVNTADVTCNGSRLWGPELQPDGSEVYLSEANGRDDVAGCTLIWTYIPAENCIVDIISLADTQTVGVADGGSLFLLQQGEVPISIPLAGPDDLTIEMLEGPIPLCSDNTGPSTGPTTTSPPSSGGAAPSCSGNRVWGPTQLNNGRELYLSEGNNLGANDSCIIEWEYDPTASCSLGGPTEATATGSIDNAGMLTFTDSSGTVALGTANIALSLLQNAPDCPEAPPTGSAPTGGVPTGGVPTDSTDESTDNDNILAAEIASAFSCNGDRVWGPFNLDDPGLTFFLSESLGNEGFTQCAILWRINTAQNCRNALFIADGVEVGVNDEGAAVINSPNSSREISIASATFQSLVDTPVCM